MDDLLKQYNNEQHKEKIIRELEELYVQGFKLNKNKFVFIVDHKEIKQYMIIYPT